MTFLKDDPRGLYKTLLLVVPQVENNSPPGGSQHMYFMYSDRPTVCFLDVSHNDAHFLILFDASNSLFSEKNTILNLAKTKKINDPPHPP